MIELKVKENAGYEIIAQIAVPYFQSDDQLLFILGKNGQGYVTWESHTGDSFYWGHYFQDYDSALADLFKRAENVSKLPSLFDRWLEEMLPWEIKDWCRDNAVDESKLLQDSDLMKYVHDEISYMFEQNIDISGSIYNRLDDVYRDYFDEEE